MAYFAMGSCLVCGNLFTFNPERVPSLRVLRGGDGKLHPDPSGSKEPICQSCMDEVNTRRREAGLDPHPILPGAYSPEPESTDTDYSPPREDYEE